MKGFSLKKYIYKRPRVSEVEHFATTYCKLLNLWRRAVVPSSLSEPWHLNMTKLITSISGWTHTSLLLTGTCLLDSSTCPRTHASHRSPCYTSFVPFRSVPSRPVSASHSSCRPPSTHHPDEMWTGLWLQRRIRGKIDIFGRSFINIIYFQTSYLNPGHSGAVVTTVNSQQEGLGLESQLWPFCAVWVCMFSLCMWVSSRPSGLLPQSKKHAY